MMDRLFKISITLMLAGGTLAVCSAPLLALLGWEIPLMVGAITLACGTGMLGIVGIVDIWHD